MPCHLFHSLTRIRLHHGFELVIVSERWRPTSVFIFQAFISRSKPFKPEANSFTVFVAYAPTSDYDDEEVEAFYVELEKFHKEDHTFYKVIVGDFNAKIGSRRSPEELHIGTHRIGLE
ncbi:unnamed protein product [Heligmosomoides polygyrus]|uniref:Endo/exonuclease/phosphatase domain-containing protein n=1 Tax=Heligmosomoides polygyrus TaxID=6339 RepID=A0A183FW89_HELPZ|nr:unnamed protein product [Heligmosomoides polygyrus]